MTSQTEPPSGPRIIRWKDLEPSWHLPKQEPGFMRWMVQWVGGPEGYYNSNPRHAVISHDIAVGFQGMPPKNRQRGLHYHTITETYVVLRGQLLGWDGYGKEHLAGPLDCIYIPAGVPHGVRSYGDEPAELLWLHDALEKRGSSTYWFAGDYNPQDDSKEDIKVVRYNDIHPNWEAAQALPPGHMHANLNYQGGVKGSQNFSPQHAVPNDKAALGLTIIPEGHKQLITGRPNAELCIIVRGKAVVTVDNRNEELNLKDAIYVPAGCSRTLRNHGQEPTYIVWVHARPSSHEPPPSPANGTLSNSSAVTDGDVPHGG
ncbi:hypothetical protein LTR67_006092 [Exophiala xenobiotica]